MENKFNQQCLEFKVDDCKNANLISSDSNHPLGSVCNATRVEGGPAGVSGGADGPLTKQEPTDSAECLSKTDATNGTLTEGSSIVNANGAPAADGSHGKPAESLVSSACLNQSFKTLDDLLRYLQVTCGQTKGHSYSIQPTKNHGQETKHGKVYQIACKRSESCPFSLQVCYEPSNKQYQISKQRTLQHDHSEKGQALTESEPFRKRIISPATPFPVISSGAPTHVLMYSSSLDGSPFPNSLDDEVDDPLITPQSHSLLESPNLSKASYQAKSPAEPIELTLKKRVKEIKHTFKQIHASKKVACAEEVLKLLRARCKEFPAHSGDFNSNSGTPTLNHTPVASTSGLQGSQESGEDDANADFPSFTISERKRKHVGTYRCRICRKEGHNSRSCEAGRAPMQSLLLGQDQLIIPGVGMKREYRSINRNIASDMHAVSIVVGNTSSSSTANQSHGEIQSTDIIIGDVLGFDNDMLHDPLLLRQSHSIDNEMIYVNVGGESSQAGH